MPWITITYHPGFAEDLTSWRTEISHDGRLSQVIEICRFNPIESRREEREVTLSSHQLRELELLVASTDLAALSHIADDICIRDAEGMHWEIEAGGGVSHMSAPLHWMERAQRQGQLSSDIPVTAALRLWNAIDRLSPHGLHKHIVV